MGDIVRARQKKQLWKKGSKKALGSYMRGAKGRRWFRLAIVKTNDRLDFKSPFEAKDLGWKRI